MKGKKEIEYSIKDSDLFSLKFYLHIFDYLFQNFY